MMPLARAQVAADSPGWQWPGSLVLRLVLVAMLAVALSGALSAWLASLASERESIRRLVGQQTEEVEVMARLLASKIEQSQKVLRTVAEPQPAGAGAGAGSPAAVVACTYRLLLLLRSLPEAYRPLNAGEKKSM